jgi:hypothetical protein
VALLNVLPRNLAGEADKDDEGHGQDSRRPGRNSNRAPTE